MARKNKDVWVAEATKLEIAQRHMVSENNDMRAKILALEAERDKLQGLIRTRAAQAWMLFAINLTILVAAIAVRWSA